MCFAQKIVQLYIINQTKRKIMTLNRTLAPVHHPTTRFFIKEAVKSTLSCGVDLYSIHDSSNEVLRIDFVYSGGVRNEPEKGISKAAITLLPEGTSEFSAEEIAEKLDSYGAYLQTNHTRDEGVVSLYCLPKHLNACLTILKTVLLDAQYPENEISTYINNSLQSLAVNEQKTSFLASRAFAEKLWGVDSAYGSSVNQNIIQNISRETLIKHSREVYAGLPTSIFVAGFVSHETIGLINNFFDVSFSSAVPLKPVILSEQVFTYSENWVDKTGAAQASIRMGKQIIGRNHPDFRELSFVNMLLGGYFGSRLMSNIREEKGLTYGIYSSLQPQFNACSFGISVELNKENVSLGLAEIKHELMRLRTEPIDNEELNVVKNYYLGSFLRGFDGVFSLLSFAKNIVDYNLSYEYYYGFLNVIKDINAERIVQLAEQYLHEDTMIAVIAGERT
jgi:zinc protease